MDNFCVFILSHGRPDNVITYNTLKKQGYTGKIYIVIDNEDDTARQYIENYNDQVIIFDKSEIASRFDEGTGESSKDRRAVVYARNACFDIAEGLGIEYFLQLDDDYTSFVYKFARTKEYREKPVKNLDKIFQYILDYYKGIDALTICMAQNGDYIGGKYSSKAKIIKLYRKAMNTFFCSTKRRFDFVGRINEDVNTYTSRGRLGELLGTVSSVAIIQRQTQGNEGGMSDIYLDSGTYIKSFYTVMYAPSCASISTMGHRHRRLHHRISWNNAAVKIISEKYRKTGNT